MKYCRSCFLESPIYHQNFVKRLLCWTLQKIVLNDVGRPMANTNFFKIHFGVWANFVSLARFFCPMRITTGPWENLLCWDGWSGKQHKTKSPELAWVWKDDLYRIQKQTHDLYYILFEILTPQKKMIMKNDCSCFIHDMFRFGSAWGLWKMLASMEHKSEAGVAKRYLGRSGCSPKVFCFLVGFVCVRDGWVPFGWGCSDPKMLRLAIKMRSSRYWLV